ncbi:MAG: SPOR domain-containing protein [Bacteroidales bacterium]|jgi:cell division septation protein DedD|nr:SPOR domain-containing protein [Bacteroidales bacterium]
MVPNKHQPPVRTPKKSNSSAIIAIIAVVLIGAGIAGYLLYPSLIKKPIPEPVIEPEPVVTLQDTIPEPNTASEPDTLEMVAEEIQPVAVDEPMVVRYDSSTTVDRGFYIIVGSFKNKSNADRLAKKLSADIETKVLFFEGSGLHRVSAGKYGYLRDAWNDMGSIRILEGCSEAWVVENR